jgi:hypothetical protein
VPGTITSPIDLWVVKGELPGYMKAVPQAG